MDDGDTRIGKCRTGRTILALESADRTGHRIRAKELMCKQVEAVADIGLRFYDNVSCV